MALSPEKMAEFLAEEMVDDFDKLYQTMAQLVDRWEKYGDQYHHLLSEEKKQWLYDRLEQYKQNMASLTED